MANKSNNNTSTKVAMAEMAKDIGYIKETLNELDNKVGSFYVSLDKYNALEARVRMLEKVLYSLLALIVVPVIGAVIALVVKR